MPTPAGFFWTGKRIDQGMFPFMDDVRLNYEFVSQSSVGSLGDFILSLLRKTRENHVCRGITAIYDVQRVLDNC
jgi:hypothetical protein